MVLSLRVSFICPCGLSYKSNTEYVFAPTPSGVRLNAWEGNVVVLRPKTRRKRRGGGGGRTHEDDVNCRKPVDGLRSTLAQYWRSPHTSNCDESIDSNFGLF